MMMPSLQIPFPRIPSNVKTKYEYGKLFLRPFGLNENDLEIDFNQENPHLVTQILESCTRDENGKILEQNFFWDLAVSKRIECLLAIVTLNNMQNMPIVFNCLNESCTKQFELEISFQNLVNLQHLSDKTEHYKINICNKDLFVRRPIGNDQIEWLKTSFTDKNSMIKAMIQRLVVNENLLDQEFVLSDEWIGNIDKAMSKFDPLINYSLDLQCPYCDTKYEYEINLEDIALQKLKEAQQNLIESVHCIASHYHWSEQQILGMSPRRRSQYIACIENEGHL